MKVKTTFNNFSRGRADRGMNGRFDLPVYNTLLDVCTNFITNFKGNAIYRSGLLSMLKFQDCAIYEFKFNRTQNYLLVFYETTLRFLAYDEDGNFGWVVDGSNDPVEVTTPYTLEESRTLTVAQNFDVMYIACPTKPQMKLTRTASNAFTLALYTIVKNPFTQVIGTISAITAANPAVVTIGSTANLRGGDVVDLAAIVGMVQLNGTSAQIDIIDSTTFSLRGVDSSAYTPYSSGGTATRQATYPAIVQFYKSRIWYGRTSTRPTTLWGSELGIFDNLEIPSSDLVPSDPLEITLAEIAQPIEWLFPGDNSLIAGANDGIVAINGGNVDTAITADSVAATLTSADGASSPYPLRKDGLIFYIMEDGRRVMYFSYDLLTDRFKAEDANFLSYNITQGGITKLRYKKDRNDLIFGIRNGDLVSLNFNEKETVVGWHEHTTNGTIKDLAVISDNEGVRQLFTLTKRGEDYYFETLAPYIDFISPNDFFTADETDSALVRQDADINAYNRYVADQLGDCVYLDNARTLSNLKSISITYSMGTITAMSSAFSSDDVGNHITYKTNTGYESGRFLITGYTSATVVSVEVLQEPTANTYSSWYKSFNSVSGLDDFEGQEVSVVTDGGYFGEFTVSSGTIDLGTEVNKVVVGEKYTGTMKSFCLGFVNGPDNTQMSMKSITQVGVRCNTSAGGKFGTNRYRLEPIQQLTPNDLNYLPPLPMDATKYVQYTDDADRDKYWYLVQDEPLPLQVTALMIDTKY